MKHLVLALAFLAAFSHCKPPAPELYQPNQPAQYRIQLQLKPADASTDYSALIDSARKVITYRLLEFQVAYSKVEADPQSGRLLIDLVGPVDTKSKDKESILQRLVNVLSTEGRLEFWDVYRPTDAPYQHIWKPLSTHTDFFGYVTPIESSWEVVVARFPHEMLDTVNRFLIEQIAKYPLPVQARPAWSLKPSEYNNNWYELYVLKGDRDGAPILNGSALEKVGASVDGNTGDKMVDLQFSEQGSSIWAAMTERAAADQNRPVAIVLNGYVVTAPRVINPITEGKAVISGNFTSKEVNDLVKTLKVGALPCPVEVLSAKVL